MGLLAEEDPEILDWLKKKQYMSPKIQNEMIEALGLGVIQEISANIQNASIYTILADESADVSNKERVVVCEDGWTRIFTDESIYSVNFLCFLMKYDMKIKNDFLLELTFGNRSF